MRSIPTNVHESSLIRDLRGLRRSLKRYSQGATVRSGPWSTRRSISARAQSHHEPRACLGRDDRPRRIAASSGASLSCLPRRAGCPRGSRSRCQWIAPRGASLRGLQDRILLREKAQRLSRIPLAAFPLGVVFRPAPRAPAITVIHERATLARGLRFNYRALADEAEYLLLATLGAGHGPYDAVEPMWWQAPTREHSVLCRRAGGQDRAATKSCGTGDALMGGNRKT